MKKKLLLIDFNNLLYRAVFANQGLSNRGKFTGGIYGFISMVSGTVNRFGLDRLVICKDTKPYHRSTSYPQYKDGRRKHMEEEALMRVSSASKQINKFIGKLGITVAERVGYEADDFIGRYCRTKHKYWDGIFVMSNDSDFYQFLESPKVFMVKTGGLYGSNDFAKDYPSIAVADWPMVAALAGSHNGVPGITGVGEVTAVKLIHQHGEDLAAYVEEKYGEEHGPDNVDLRRKLSTFPFPLAPRLTLPWPRQIHYNAKKLQTVCDKYGIRFKDEFHNAFLRLAAE